MHHSSDPYMSYRSKVLNGGYTGNCVGDFYRGDKGDTMIFDYMPSLQKG